MSAIDIHNFDREVVGEGIPCVEGKERKMNCANGIQQGEYICDTWI